MPERPRFRGIPNHTGYACLLSGALLCVAVFMASLAVCRPHAQARAGVVMTISGTAISAAYPAETPHATHCILHCIAYVTPLILLFSALYRPNVGRLNGTVTRLFARLDLPPLLPPPRSAHTLV